MDDDEFIVKRKAMKKIYLSKFIEKFSDMNGLVTIGKLHPKVRQTILFEFLEGNIPNIGVMTQLALGGGLKYLKEGEDITTIEVIFLDQVSREFSDEILVKMNLKGANVTFAANHGVDTTLRIYSVDFDPMYPVGGHLILAAKDEDEGMKIAQDTITHGGEIKGLTEIVVMQSGVISYDNGDY